MPDPMNDRDIVIVFGAGASYGAGHVLPATPPLGLSRRLPKYCTSAVLLILMS
jgi:hypothetical protein